MEVTHRFHGCIKNWELSPVPLSKYHEAIVDLGKKKMIDSGKNAMS